MSMSAASHTIERNHPRISNVMRERMVNALTAMFVFAGMMSLIEPSPYDFLSLLAIPVWFFCGFKIPRIIVPVLLLWTLREVAGFAALMPHWEEPTPRLFQLQSLYLYVTVIFFTIYFSQNTQQRAQICLNAFTAGVVFSAAVAIASYLHLFGLDRLTTVEGRVAGTFKDPNVFGSYLTLGAVYLMQNLLLGTTRRPVISFIGLGITLAGVFLSFSRGSWAAVIFALGIMTIAGFATSRDAGTRKRIIIVGSLALATAVLALLIVLSNDSIREFFLQRATVTQDYDEGVTGRFGNQLRSLPMLLDSPLGFGPLRFRLIFDLEPHNSYIGAFANGGWLGGFCWFTLIILTGWIGVRLMIVASPVRRLAQVFVPALLALLLQGFQIDIDHWRQLFLLFGAVWGLEAGRVEAMRRAAIAGPQPAPMRVSA